MTHNPTVNPTDNPTFNPTFNPTAKRSGPIVKRTCFNYLLQAEGETSGPDIQADFSKASGLMKHQLEAVPTHGNRNWVEEMWTSGSEAERIMHEREHTVADRLRREFGPQGVSTDGVVE